MSSTTDTYVAVAIADVHEDVHKCAAVVSMSQRFIAHCNRSGRIHVCVSAAVDHGKPLLVCRRCCDTTGTVLLGPLGSAQLHYHMIGQPVVRAMKLASEK